MPKILFPENAWTLGVLNGVSEVSSRLSPSKNIKVTITNNTENDLTGKTLIMIPHNYVFDLVDLSKGEPQFYTESGELLPYTITHTFSKEKKQFGCFLQPTVGELPISFNVGETITLVCDGYSEAKPLGLTIPTIWDGLSPCVHPPSGETLIATNPESRRLAWFFYGTFKESEETRKIAAHSSRTITITGDLLRGYSNQTYTLPNKGPYLGVKTTPSDAFGDPYIRFTLFNSATGAFIATIYNSSSSDTYNEYINPNVLLPGFKSLYLTDSGSMGNTWWDKATGRTIMTDTILPFLREDYSYSWSFNNTEEMYWLSPIIQLPHKGYLSSDWLETLGTGRVDIDGLDPQEYEIRYSDTAPDGDPLGTDLANNSGADAAAMPTLSYWAPKTAWAPASEWASAQKGHGAGPAKYYQVRVKFQQPSGGE